MQPCRAPVRPRVLSPQTGEALLAEEEVRRHIDEGRRGAIALLGPPGSGRTTALAHIAASFPPGANVLFLDEPSFLQVLHGFEDKLIVFTAETAPGLISCTNYKLAPWDEDSLIEYLLAVHKPRCASVMARLPPQDRELFDGLPEVWHIILDHLAADEKLHGARGALHRHLETQLADTDLVERARSICLNLLTAPPPEPAQAMRELSKPGFEKDLLRVLRHPAVQRVLATERIAADLHGEAQCDFLALRLERELVHAAATAIFHDERPLEHLRALLAGPAWSHAMAASILHATKTGWTPAAGLSELTGAYLPSLVWPGALLAGAKLDQTDLSHADLRAANLADASACRAVWSEIRLVGASLKKFRADGADLALADLTAVQGEKASFIAAGLQGADLTSARLPGAAFHCANLTGAMLVQADLRGANFGDATIAKADFAAANLTKANLAGLRLREARFVGACFRGAKLSNCDMEGMELPEADFTRADLRRALLTGSNMPGATFIEAYLWHAKLAEVNWEGVCLRDADLRGATFHMGSSRGGLVGSIIPCEGSKTGFYTDPYDEQCYKEPEEIRKANLCGADLRGARIENVDFYLVDLRGARLDAWQAKHLRRCGAILERRTV